MRVPAHRLLARRLRAFGRDRAGTITLLTVMLIVALTGVAGLVADVGYAYREKNILLTSAEAAALAAAKHIPTQDRSAALAVAQTYASRNRTDVNDLVVGSNLEFGRWSNGAFTAGTDANAVRVTASRTGSKRNGVATSFAKLFGLDAWDVSASAIAAMDVPLCILTLNPSADDSLEIKGGARLDAPGCSVHVNSTHREAVVLGSSSYTKLKSLRIVGGVDRSGSAQVDPTPSTGATAMKDPYASLAPPTNGRCGGAKSIKNTTTTINANFAFCDGLQIESATVTFSPGVYVIKGNFTLKSGAAIKGDGVLIYVEGKGHDIFFYSRTSFELKAPKTGPYAGIVIWSDKNNTNDHDIYSKFGASAEGTIYAPSSQVEFENDVVWEAKCIRIVVGRLQLDNDSRYSATDPQANCTNNVYGAGARLVR